MNTSERLGRMLEDFIAKSLKLCAYKTYNFLTVCPILHVTDPVLHLVLCDVQFGLHGLHVPLLGIQSFCGLQMTK